jgi:hypothetical protein
MRKVFMAIALAGALAMGSVQALASSDNGLHKQGETALQNLKQARATCFDKLQGTFDKFAVPDSNEALAEAALQAARDAIDHGSVNALSAITGLKAAVEAVEEDDEDGATAQLEALRKAIEKANTATAAIPTECDKANTALKNALTLLGGTPAVNDEDEDDTEADDSPSNTAKVMVKHEKLEHEKKHEREHEKHEMKKAEPAERD